MYNIYIYVCIYVYTHVHGFPAQTGVPRMMPVMLPHDIVCGLEKYGRLQKLASPEQLAEFWTHFRNEVSEEICWPAHAPAGHPGPVPLGIHGDDCRFTDTGQKICCISLNILVDNAQTRFPLVAIRIASSSDSEKLGFW